VEYENAIYAKNIKKDFKGFGLSIDELKIPKGYATALIGENGAGKTTLLNILSGIRLDYTGEINYFGKYNDKDREENPHVKECIGYTAPGNYFLPGWNAYDIDNILKAIFKTYDTNRFWELANELSIFSDEDSNKKKKVTKLSDGTRMKLMLACVFARDTGLLILDEPASPLDPLMRDKLCTMISSYIEKGGGEKSVFFSTHNVSDMEGITDYAIIMGDGKITEYGSVEDLKEKYILVKGEREDSPAARNILFDMNENKYGFEGICLSNDLDKLAGMNISKERASLYQISVAVMKKGTRLK